MMWLSDFRNVDPTGLRLFKSDQISKQCTFSAPRSAENGEDRSSLNVERDVFYEHLGAPTDP